MNKVTFERDVRTSMGDPDHIAPEHLLFYSPLQIFGGPSLVNSGTRVSIVWGVITRHNLTYFREEIT